MYTDEGNWDVVGECFAGRFRSPFFLADGPCFLRLGNDIPASRPVLLSTFSLALIFFPFTGLLYSRWHEIPRYVSCTYCSVFLQADLRLNLCRPYSCVSLECDSLYFTTVFVN